MIEISDKDDGGKSSPILTISVASQTITALKSDLHDTNGAVINWLLDRKGRGRGINIQISVHAKIFDVAVMTTESVLLKEKPFVRALRDYGGQISVKNEDDNTQVIVFP